MKRIILFLALLSLGVSKAQVVGGYLPLNSTKSATMGGLRVNGNETVTGTFSVGSTATVSGNALFGSSVSIGSPIASSSVCLRASKGTATIDFGNPFSGYSAMWMNTPTVTSSNFLVASDGANPSFNGLTTLAFQVANSTKLLANSGGINVTGSLTASSTFSLGSANLTGGNTGTVAVLSDAVFPVQFFPSTQSPADGTTYYIGQTLWDWTWSATTGRVYLPYNCTLVGATIVQRMSVLGSAESVSISVRANNTTDYSLTVTQTFSASPVETNITGLSHSFSANDAINIKVVCPTFATNPTNIYLGIILWFVRRS